MTASPGSRGLFITGTDTGVGKTMVAAALAAWCRRRGLDTGVMKPIATGGVRMGGVSRGRVVSQDARILAQAAGAADRWEEINPVCFAEPLAPLTAARRVCRAIRLERVIGAFRRLAARHDLVIVEGIGGLLVPLTGRLTVADLGRRIGLPLVVVARPDLGTLNHTLLTVRAARHAGLTVAGLVINYPQPAARDVLARLAQRTNPALLEELSGAPLLGVIPYVAAGEDRTDPAALARLAERYLQPRFLEALLPGGGRRSTRRDASCKMHTTRTTQPCLEH